MHCLNIKNLSIKLAKYRIIIYRNAILEQKSINYRQPKRNGQLCRACYKQIALLKSNWLTSKRNWLKTIKGEESIAWMKIIQVYSSKKQGLLYIQMDPSPEPKEIQLHTSKRR